MSIKNQSHISTVAALFILQRQHNSKADQMSNIIHVFVPCSRVSLFYSHSLLITGEIKMDLSKIFNDNSKRLTGAKASG